MIEKQYDKIRESCFEAVLPNGLMVRIVPKKDFARKYAFLATNYGSIDTTFRLGDEVVKSPDGVAHYLEHKMFDMPDQDVIQAFANMGANPNAFTSHTMTAYHFDCTDHFEDCLKLLLSYVYTPYFTKETVDKERGIISQEICMGRDSAYSRIYENLYQAMFDEHPIRVPIAGSVESIQKISEQTLYDCYKTFYDPSNMMLCVVGDVDPETVLKIAEELTPISNGTASQRFYGNDDPDRCPRHRVSEKMEVAMPSFMLGFRFPDVTRGMEGMCREVIGDLASEVLAGDSSRLYASLYEKGLIDSGFSAGYESMDGLGMFVFEGDSADPDAVAEAIFQEAQRIAEEGIAPDYFAGLVKSALGRRYRDLDSFESICYRMCSYYFDNADYFKFTEAFAAVTSEAVMDMLRNCIQEKNSVLSVILPNEKGSA